MPGWGNGQVVRDWILIKQNLERFVIGAWNPCFDQGEVKLPATLVDEARGFSSLVP